MIVVVIASLHSLPLSILYMIKISACAWDLSVDFVAFFIVVAIFVLMVVVLSAQCKVPLLRV